MRVVTNRRLVEFAARHPEAARPLQAWRQLMEAQSYASFAELRQCFSSVDKVGDLHVFDTRVVELADVLVDSGQAETGAALEDLFVVITELIADYDRRHFLLPTLPPRDLLRFLMEQHGLTQSDRMRPANPPCPSSSSVIMQSLATRCAAAVRRCGYSTASASA